MSSSSMLRFLVGCCLAAVALARCGMDPEMAKGLQWQKRNVVTWEYGLSKELTDLNWDERLDEFEDKPVFIQFFAPWDRISQMISDEWAKLANDVNAPDSNYSFVVAHVNSIESTDISELFRINKWPTIKVMHGDQMYTYNTSGPQSQQTFRDFGNGGFRDVHSRTLGGSPMDPILDGRDDAEVIFRDVFGTAVPLIGSGALGGLGIGLLVARLVLACSSSSSSSEARRSKGSAGLSKKKMK